MDYSQNIENFQNENRIEWLHRTEIYFTARLNSPKYYDVEAHEIAIVAIDFFDDVVKRSGKQKGK